MLLTIIFFAGFFSIFEIRAMTDTQLEIIKSISDELYKKQIIIVNNLSKEIEIDKYLKIVKYFSNFKIYTVFQSPNEMRPTLLELVSSGYPTYKYKPRTMAVIDNDAFQDMAKLYFNLDYDFVTPKITWIFFNNSHDNIKNKIDQSYIPYNCQFLLINQSNDTNYEINEIYKINHLKKHFQVTKFGKWNKTNHLTVPVNDFYGRRLDFNGTILGVLSSCKWLNGKLGCPFPELSGFHEIIGQASEIMNVRYAHLVYGDKMSLDNFYKYYNSTIEFLFESIHFFDSSDYYENVVPIWNARAYLHVAYNKEYEKGMSSPFIRPFTKPLWVSVGAWIFASSLIMLVISYILHRNQLSIEFHEILDACFLSFESFTNQCGRGTPPKTDSHRIATFTILIPPLFLVLAYSATIISFITVQIIQLPFYNLEELTEDGTFKIGYPKDSFIKIWFENTQDPVARLAYEKFTIAEDYMPSGTEPGAIKMCTDPKFSFIHFDDMMFHVKYDCQPLQIYSPLFQTNFALGLHPSSHLKAVLSKIINSTRSSGFLSGLKSHALYFNTNQTLLKNTKYFLHFKNFEIDTVDWKAVESIFVLLVIAYSISIAILLLERYIFIRTSKKFVFQDSEENDSTNIETFTEVFSHDLSIEDLD